MQRRTAHHLGNGATHELRRCIAPLPGDGIELHEGVEKLVVAGATSHVPVTHGESIHDVPVVHGVLEDLRGRALARNIPARDGRSRCPVSVGKRKNVDAERQLRRPLDVALRVDGARQVCVEIGALREGAEKGPQRGTVLANALEMTSRSLLE